MRIISWNTQGDKWDSVYTDRVAPYRMANPASDLLLLTCEAGWAPWVKRQTVSRNRVYDIKAVSQTGWGKPGMHTPFTDGMNAIIQADRSATAGWVPWVKIPAAVDEQSRTNSRCSLGYAWVPGNRTTNRLLLDSVDTFQIDDRKFRRPFVRVFLKTAGSNVPTLSICFVHLYSGNANVATVDYQWIVDAMTEMSLTTIPTLFVGDMNIDLLTVAPPPLPNANQWRILRTHQATHQSGSELDFAILFDPKGSFRHPAAVFGPGWKTMTNGSDHAVVSYDLV